MKDEIIEIIGKSLQEHGYELDTVRMEGPDLYLIRVARSEPPPPLGIHVSDGIGAKTKMG